VAQPWRRRFYTGASGERRPTLLRVACHRDIVTCQDRFGNVRLVARCASGETAPISTWHQASCVAQCWGTSRTSTRRGRHRAHRRADYRIRSTRRYTIHAPSSDNLLTEAQSTLNVSWTRQNESSIHGRPCSNKDQTALVRNGAAMWHRWWWRYSSTFLVQMRRRSLPHRLAACAARRSSGIEKCSGHIHGQLTLVIVRPRRNASGMSKASTPRRRSALICDSRRKSEHRRLGCGPPQRQRTRREYVFDGV